MKKALIFTSLIFFSIAIVTDDAFAIRSRKDYFLKPQIGMWFGPITPIYKTEDAVDTDIGLGLFLRYNTPFKPLKIGFDTSYQHYDSKGVNKLLVVPVYGSFVYLLPLTLPVKIQVKLGAGSSYVYIDPDQASQWDPIFMTGVELSFPAGRIVNIGLRIEYLYFYEGYADGATRGGHLVNAGISLYFNLNL